MLCSLCGHDIDASVTDDVRDGRTGRCRLVCFSMHISFLIVSFGFTVSFFHFPCCIFLILWEDVALFFSLVTTLAFLLFLFLTHVVSI